MLSVNYISNFLNSKQELIEDKFYNSLNNFELNENFEKNNIKINETLEKNSSITKKYETIYDSLHYFFDNDSNKFSIYKKLENNNELYTFMNSLLSIGDEIFMLNNFQNKKGIMKNLIKKMDDDLLKEDLYFLYNYDKNRKFNKEKIMTTLKELYKFNVERETIHLFKQYLSDYLGINIFIIGIINNTIDYDNKEFYLTHKYGLNYNKYAQTFILISENNLYYPLIKNSNNNFNGLNYEEIKNYLPKFINFYNIKIEEDIINKKEKEPINNIINKENKIINNNNENDLKKLKLEELRKKALEKNISIQKISDKTSKMINKIKAELIEDLLKNNSN
jgi:hypothetical protein